MVLPNACLLRFFFQKENADGVKIDPATLNVSPSAKQHNSILDSIHDPIISNIVPDCISPDSFSNIFAQTSLPSLTKVERDPSQVQGYSQCTAQKSVFPASVQSSLSSLSQNESLSNSQNALFRRAANGRPKF